MKLLLITFLFLCSALSAYAQDTKIIYLKEKAKQLNAEDASQLVSARSIERRERQNIPFDQLDLPVDNEILRLLNEEGQVLNVSKWLNAVTYSSNLTVEELIEKFDFIDRIQVVSHQSKAQTNKFGIESKSLNYGAATQQIEQLNLDCLHDLGFTGSGIFLGVIDAGFRKMDSVGYFDSVYLEGRVLDTYNFVNTTATVYGFSGHGTAVSSCIVAEGSNPDQYIGSAVDVDLGLYLTEDVSSETEIEEFNLVSALERADSVGIDLVNISLGYVGFDDSTTSHVYADMDGVTTIAAIGVNVAKSKGIFVTAAAGNSGPSTISTPCDATGAMCVGAVTWTGDYAWFSSVGPSSDGRIKPDVMARGGDAGFINTLDSLQFGNGTSFASPILAGGVACLIQAHPGSTVDEVMDAIRESATLFNTPNDSMGYGIPDFCLANDILTANAGIQSGQLSEVAIYPNPTSQDLIISGLSKSKNGATIKVYDKLGRLVMHSDKTVENGALKLDVSNLSNGLYNLVLQQEDVEIRRTISVSK